MARKFDFGHLRSQKFAALVFCVAVLGALAFFLADTVFSTLVMGVVALYTAFVGGRAWSDNAALKFGAVTPTNDVQPIKKPATPAPKKEKDNELD